MEGLVSHNFANRCSISVLSPVLMITIATPDQGKIIVNFKSLFLSIPLLLASGSVVADAAALPFDNDTACMEGPLAQFGRYIGNWNIEDSQLGQNGETWSPGDGARWNFACLGNGTAIQDFWMPPDGTIGTNLRTYNSQTESWDIAWAIDALPGFAHIQAVQDDDGNIVMHYKSPLPDPLRRITFFPPDDSGWNWKLELSRDGGDNWFEVYRIKATRSD